MASAIAGAAAARERSYALSGDAIALAGLVVLGAVLAVVTWGTWGALSGDTGYDFVAATRMAHGQLPYIDYTYYYGPLPPAMLGFAAWIGGASVATFAAVGLLIAFAATAGTYALARTWTGPFGAAVAAALVLPVALGTDQTGYVLPHATGASLGALMVLCVVLALRKGWIAAAGVAAGLATLTKPEFALAAYATCAVWLLFAAGRRSDWARVLAPALVIPAAVYGAFVTQIPLHRLLFENLNPRDFLNAAGNAVLRARMPWTVSSFASLGAKLVLYAVGVAALLLTARLLARGGTARRALLAVLALVGVLAAAGSVADPNALRHGLEFAYGWIPAGAAVGAILMLRRRREDPLGLAAVVGLAVLAGTTYAGFYLYAWNAQMATYAMPLAAALLVRLHFRELARSREAAVLGAAWLVFLAVAGVGLTVRAAHQESGTVRGPGGTLRDLPALASAYQRAADVIAAKTAPGEPILLAPQMSWLYTLAHRDDPVREISLLPGMQAGAGREQTTISTLEAKHVRLAVIDRHTFPAFEQTYFGGSFDRRVDQWIRSRFVRIARFTTGSGNTSPVLEIWLRRKP